jgi:inner membrane transporter RhtA
VIRAGSVRRESPPSRAVLMSLEPAVAALVGLVALGEVLSARQLTAIALVVAASIGASRQAGLDGARDL